MKNNIFLIGFMGTGKSAIAKQINKIEGYNICEMDQMIESAEGRKITEIFETDGEAYFREVESKILEQCGSEANRVVSCGGGIVLKSENIEFMKKNGVVIWLTATPETIFNRVSRNKNRPLLNNNMNVEHITKMLGVRYEKYQAAADIQIVTDDKSPRAIAEEILGNSRINLDAKIVL